jgi:ribosome-associated protein
VKRRRGQQEDDEEFIDGRGRTKARQQVKLVDEFARELVALPDHKLKKLPVTEKLRDALIEARSISEKSARRRALRFASGLLRERPDEMESIKNFLEGKAHQVIDEDLGEQALVELREALADPDRFDDALLRAQEMLPHLDVIEVQTISISIHRGAGQRAMQKLFKELRRAVELGEEFSEDE